MRAIRIGFIIGGLTVLSGLLVVLTAHGLATQWESLGNNFWGGATDPARERLYQNLGWLVMGFGMFLNTITFSRWLEYAGRKEWTRPDRILRDI